MEVEAISTGSLGLDIALGIGGLPEGRIIEIFGPESSGKTTLALHVIAEAQKKGGACGFVDAEHALDAGYAHKLGVNLEELLISQPDTGEQALEITDTLVRSGAIDVWWSTRWRRWCRKPRSKARWATASWHAGPPYEPGAAQADRLHFEVELPCDLHQPDPHEDRRDVRQPGDDDRRQRAEVLRLAFGSTSGASAQSRSATKVVGNSTRVKVVKNKVAPPFKEVEFDIMYGEGISKTGELVDLGVKANIVEKSGSWYSYDSERIGQGRENAKLYLRNNPPVAEAIEREIRANAGLIAARILDGADGDEDASEGEIEAPSEVAEGRKSGRR